MTEGPWEFCRESRLGYMMPLTIENEIELLFCLSTMSEYFLPKGFFYLVLWSKLSRLNEQKSYTFEEMIEHLKTLYDESVFDNLDAVQNLKGFSEFKLSVFPSSSDPQTDTSTTTKSDDFLAPESSGVLDERRPRKISVNATQRKARTRTQTPYSPISNSTSSRSQSQPNDIRRSGRRGATKTADMPEEQNNTKIKTRQQKLNNGEYTESLSLTTKSNEPIATRSRKAP
ncbi:unnamed protein product [Didymodactylos carnosus]|uniref:Uncharacterized protein n=1 Tax=Didymodactylos carnosus TaxID=1234261 RepID=A0A814CSQ2_9BILA|nr:unnamed protein product [Didymodactylos carnosus]CAF0945284.1 unnamed protein product [Didymodactylos carnosus]CAF3522356.1 unnamed protein product [Didymodactylos carnosus]CAF3721488.1 unnamed protein product [Didymodactylos carnosus]